MSAILNALSRGALVWRLLMAAESLQGVLRHLFLSPALELALHQLSVIVGVAVIFAITFGIAVGLGLNRVWNGNLVRAMGAAIVAAGVYFLLQ